MSTVDETKVYRQKQEGNSFRICRNCSRPRSYHHWSNERRELMCENANIERLETLDMPSDERRTFYALEWLNPKNGDKDVYVYSQEAERDRCAEHELRSGYKVCIYDIVAHFNSDLTEAEDFARDNMRINS